MKKIKASIIIVTLNSGDDLIRTIQSVISQTYVNFEILIKDGLSTDDSLQNLPNDSRVVVYSKKDHGIYDAMNQAIEHTSGDITIFMNSGDLFYDKNVLSNVCQYIEEKGVENTIYYGDCYLSDRNVMMKYPDVFDNYTCFTKVLCHQATIYSTSMLKKRGFNCEYKIASDYEYYVNAYVNGYKLRHIPFVIARYQGNGASETKDNRRNSIVEGNQIRKKYFVGKIYWKLWLKAQFHGVGLKHLIAKVELTYPLYKKMAELYYKKLEI